MIDNGLKGKVVKTDNPHFIGFLYPNFPFVSQLAFSKDIPGIIYAGDKYLNEREKRIVTVFHSKEYLAQTGIPFVSLYSTDGQYDIDLTGINGRINILDLVYSRWGFDYNKYIDVDILEVLLQIDEQDFYDFAKYRWYSKKQCVNIENIGVYSNRAIPILLNKPTEGIYAEVLSVESRAALDTLELSISHFIMKSKEQSYNPERKDTYNTMLKAIDLNTRGKEMELALILSKYRNMNHNKRLKLIWLVTELKKLIKTGDEHNAN